MDRKAQGAMEYMMSYGWAILAVMVVGGAVWQLGILNPGSAQPPTSTGFMAVKPLLATCEAGKGLPYQTTTGIRCNFINMGEDIEIYDIRATVNGKSCSWMSVLVPSGWPYFSRSCSNGDCTVTSTVICAGNYPLKMRKDGIMRVESYTANNVPAPPCSSIEVGERYHVSVEILYNSSVGGVISRQRSTGTVDITASQSAVTTTLASPCSGGMMDGICPAGCSDNADRDCCEQHWGWWIPGFGCI
jgi:hypothetical protein